VSDVDRSGFPGDQTTMTFTSYHTSAWSGSGPYPTPIEWDTFTATRTRSDGFRRGSAKKSGTGRPGRGGGPRPAGRRLLLKISL